MCVTHIVNNKMHKSLLMYIRSIVFTDAASQECAAHRHTSKKYDPQTHLISTECPNESIITQHMRITAVQLQQNACMLSMFNSPNRFILCSIIYAYNRTHINLYSTWYLNVYVRIWSPRGGVLYAICCRSSYWTEFLHLNQKRRYT